jgi:tetratricopeptide (TPR) repeat protein
MIVNKLRVIVFGFIPFVLLTSLSISSAQNKPDSNKVYKEFIQKKDALKTEFKAMRDLKKEEFVSNVAKIKSQIVDLSSERASTEEQIDDIRRSIARQKMLHQLLLLDGEWYNFPIFIIMLFLIYLIIRRQAPTLTRNYNKHILIAIGILTFMYALGAMAKPLPSPHESRAKIEQNLNLFNRLQDASEVDKLIIKIEQQTKGQITIDDFDISNKNLYVITTFKKGSLEEFFTLAALYHEAGQTSRAQRLLYQGVSSLKKFSKKHAKLLRTSWQFFMSIYNLKGTFASAMLLAQSRVSLRDYLTSVTSLRETMPEQSEELLKTLLKKMKLTSDYLAAAIYLHRLNRLEESAKMYQKALKTARSTADYLGLAKYALDNNLPESALQALDKAFKRARRTKEWISYSKFAREISHDSAETAYDKAIKSARSSDDYLQLTKYCLQLSRVDQATKSLTAGLKKARKVEELLQVVDLALKMKERESYIEGMTKTVKIAKRFKDMLPLIRYAYQQGESKIYNQVLIDIIPKARKSAQLNQLLKFILVADLPRYISPVVAQIASRRLKPQQYRALRSELINAGHLEQIAPIHVSLTKYTSNERKLYQLSEEFKSIGRPVDASLPIIKLLKRTGRVYKIKKILSFSLNNQLFVSAREATAKLIKKRRGSDLIEDPNLLSVSTLKPNGIKISLITLYAILCQRTGQIDLARATLESQISAFLEEYIKEQTGELKGDINTYFYLHQLWVEAEDPQLLTQFDTAYRMVEDIYLENMKEKLKTQLNIFTKDLNLELSREEKTLASAQSQLELIRLSLSRVREQSNEDQIKSIALISRSLVYLFIIIIALLIAGFISWHYQLSLTAFHTTGFILKFLEIIGIVMCTNLRIIQFGIAVVIFCQLLLMLLHIHQESDQGTSNQRFSDTLEKNQLWKRLIQKD